MSKKPKAIFEKEGFTNVMVNTAFYPKKRKQVLKVFDEAVKTGKIIRLM